MEQVVQYEPLFKEYREKRRYSTNRNHALDDREKLFDTIQKLLKDYDKGKSDKLEMYFEDSQNPKRNALAILVEFDEYIKKKHSVRFKNIPEVTNLYSSHIERHLQLLKEMHEPKKVSELAEALHINESTANHYIKDLENGFMFMDSEIKVHIHREHRQDRCRSVVHPVFLALNSTELSLLLSYLQESNDQAIGRVGNLIYSQLTEYAKKKICPNVTTFSDTISPNYDDEFYRTNDDALGYLSKRAFLGRPFNIEFDYKDSNGAFITAKGRLVSHNFQDGTYKIITEDGKELDLTEDEIYLNTEVLYS